MEQAPSQQDPQDQGLAMGLLMQTMALAVSTGDLTDLEDLVVLLTERNVPNLELLYELAQEAHPEMPTLEELEDQMAEGANTPQAPRSDEIPSQEKLLD